MRLASPFDSLGGKSNFSLGGVPFEVIRQFSAFGGYDIVITMFGIREKSWTIHWEDVKVKKVGNPWKGEKYTEATFIPGKNKYDSVKDKKVTPPARIDPIALSILGELSLQPDVKSYNMGKYSKLLNEYITEARKDLNAFVKAERSGDPWKRRTKERSTTTKPKTMATRKRATTAKASSTAKEPTLAQLKPKAKRLGIKLTTTQGNPKKKAQLLKEVKAAESKAKAKRTRAKNKKAVDMTAVYPQVGRSVKRYDVMRSAKPPGWRRSKTGRVYFENRKNRSDMPGTLEEKYNGWANYWTWRFNLEMADPDLANLFDELPSQDRYDQAEFLKDYAIEMVYREPEAFIDWVTTIMQEIEWGEIVDALLE